MKAGFEQRGKVIAMIVLGILAIAVFWYSLSNPSAPPATAAAPSAAPAKAINGRASAAPRRLRPSDARRPPQERSLDPTLHFELLKASEDVQYKGTKCNIFTGQCGEAERKLAAKTGPPPPHCPDDNDPRCGPPPPNCTPGAAPDPRCPPPPIPLQFFGFASRPGEPKRIFLKTTDTNDVFVASEGQVVNRRYRVLRIMNSGVEIEDVLNNNKQVLPLSQG
jgi:hypothetical protein